MHELEVQKLSKEKKRKETKVDAGFSVSTLGLLPRVWEMRR